MSYQQPPTNEPWQQQPFPPMQPLPGPPPKKKRSPLFWIMTILIVFGVGGAIINTVHPPPGTSTTTTTTETQATDTPVPADTPQPTVAPLTDKAAIKAQLQADISNLALVGDSINADYSDHAVVLVALNTRPEHGYLVALVQNECYSVQKTVWQDPLLQNVNWLDYSVFTQDSQGLPVVLGECILHAQQAESINWDTYDATSAWEQKIYENMMLV